MRNARLGMLRDFLHYKCQQAGRGFKVVDEQLTTQGCSACGAVTGPKGVSDLSVRVWICRDCGTWHNRDANSGRNILARAQVSGCKSGDPVPGRGASVVSGNEAPFRSESGRAGQVRPCEAGGDSRSGAP
jgi:transposase